MPYTRDNRFQNTLRDLLDCQEYLEEGPLSEPEELARVRLIEVCREIGAMGGQIPEGRDRPGIGLDRG